MDRQTFINRLNEDSALNIIFQLTDKCVLSCRYCFARGAHGKKTPSFSDVILEKAIHQAFETHHKRVVFEWTGGESFLVGIEFYRKVVKYQKKYATKEYDNCVQTSGGLLDKKLVDFLIDHDFSISTTLDGPKEIHNANRPTVCGEESFDLVQETRRYYKEKAGRNMGFIATITQNNIGHEKEMMDFVASQGLNSFHSNPYIFFPKYKVKDESIALNNEDYARYFISEFNAWIDSGREKPVPTIVDYVLKCIATQQPTHETLCSFGGRCLTNFIAIIPNGDAFVCPKYTGNDNMKLGNITKTEIKDILSVDSPQMHKLIDERLVAINNCEKKGCKWFYICNGGDPYYSYIASNGKNVMEEDCMCKGKTMLFEYLESIYNDIKDIYGGKNK